MAKTIKVIDLLNMRYKNEKMPKNIRIKYSFVFDYYIYNKEMKWYETADKTSILDVFQKLDYEVEILEDNIEEIEEQQDIDIQSIEELPKITFLNITEKSLIFTLNDIIYNYNKQLQAVKQLDKKIKE